MLESVRENLKGTLVVVVIIIFIVPMVISGVGSSFSGSVSGTDVASVNGQKISELELDRAIRSQRNRMVQQAGLDTSSPYLSDENLRAPVLENLSRRAALISEGRKSGMAISNKAFGEMLSEQKEFFTDGKFDQQKYRSLLAQAQFTSSTYRQEVAGDMIVNQQSRGLQLSAFSTAAEFNQLVSLTHQKRSFYSIKIPVEKAQSGIETIEQDLVEYYEETKQAYLVPEKVKIDYLELNLDAIAETIEVDESDILAQYEAEVANFSDDAKYSVAHILLEDSDGAKIAEITEKLSQDTSFEKLAEDYSDDIATNMSGGELGVLTPEMFPKEFEDAVYSLEEGQVSDPVKTDAGTHFIKVTKKSKTDVPTFERRREDIKREIARAKAQEGFASKIDTLGELTFSSDGLKEAASALGLTIKSSGFFDVNTGSGIANNASIRTAAFDEEVLKNGHNSNTIELDPSRTVVLRVNEHKEAYTRPFEEVKVLVEARVRDKKIADNLSALVSKLKSELSTTDSDAKLTSEQNEYTFMSFELAKRSDVSVDQEVIRLAFSADKPAIDTVSYNSAQAQDGGYWLVGVSAVENGTPADLEEVEKQGFMAQIARESASFDSTIYEAAVVDKAKIKLN